MVPRAGRQLHAELLPMCASWPPSGDRRSCTSLVRCRAGPGRLPVLRCPVGALLVKQVIARARRHRARADRSDEPRRTKYRPISTRARAVDGTVDGRRMRMEGSQGSEGRTTRWRRVPQHIPNGLPLLRTCTTARNTKGHTLAPHVTEQSQANCTY